MTLPVFDALTEIVDDDLLLTIASRCEVMVKHVEEEGDGRDDLCSDIKADMQARLASAPFACPLRPCHTARRARSSPRAAGPAPPFRTLR